MTATNKKLKKETKSQQKTNLLIETICKCTFALFFFHFSETVFAVFFCSLFFYLFFIIFFFFYWFSYHHPHHHPHHHHHHPHHISQPVTLKETTLSD